MLVAEKARFTYNGKNFTYDGLVHKTLTGTDLTKMDTTKKAIASNFLKVPHFAKDEGMFLGFVLTRSTFTGGYIFWKYGGDESEGGSAVHPRQRYQQPRWSTFFVPRSFASDDI